MYKSCWFKFGHCVNERYDYGKTDVEHKFINLIAKVLANNKKKQTAVVDPVFSELSDSN